MYKIVRARPDGSCFFHSVGFLTDMKASDLRMIVSKLILKHKHSNFNDLTLSNWILYETGLTAEQYSHQILFHKWGGALEMKLLSDFFNRSIVVYSRSGSRSGSRGSQADRILVVHPSEREECPSKGPILLLYSGNSHYDAILEPSSNQVHSQKGRE